MDEVTALMLGPGDRFTSPELQSLIECRDSSGPSRSAYRVLGSQIGNGEVALIRFDLSHDELCLYEIYVLPEHQNRGVGSWAVEFAKQLARDRKDHRTVVRPRSLSDPSRDVVPFYVRNGFTCAPDSGGGLMELLLDTSN